MEGNGRMYAFYDKPVKGAFHFGNRFRPVFAVNDKLCYERIILRRDDISLIYGRVYSYTRAAGKSTALKLSVQQELPRKRRLMLLLCLQMSAYSNRFLVR